MSETRLDVYKFDGAASLLRALSRAKAVIDRQADGIEPAFGLRWTVDGFVTRT